MKKFDTVKTVQLVLTILLACTALITILRDTELYSMIAVNPHVRLLAFVLWIVLGLSFIGRNGGNKFLAIFRECSEARLEKFCSSVEAQVQARNELLEVPLRYSAGSAFREGEKVQTITELVALSDRRAWQNSGHMQNQI